MAMARICLIVSVKWEGLPPPQKIASAWRAANTEPALEDPAWNKTGVR